MKQILVSVLFQLCDQLYYANKPETIPKRFQKFQSCLSCFASVLSHVLFQFCGDSLTDAISACYLFL